VAPAHQATLGFLVSSCQLERRWRQPLAAGHTGAPRFCGGETIRAGPGFMTGPVGRSTADGRLGAGSIDGTPTTAMP
jgi:hypothetical protein